MANLARGLIDCDIHPGMPTAQALAPFLDEYWLEMVKVGGTVMNEVPLASYPVNTPLASRPDWRPEKGKPAADVDIVRRQLLDVFDARIGILNCIHGGQAVYNGGYAMALCRAVNSWIAAEWLDKEPRLRASIIVPNDHPERAIEEVERCAADKRFVQILFLGAGERLLGQRCYWPIYELAEMHGLTIGVHAGSTYRNAPTFSGWGSFYLEDYVDSAQGCAAQLLSLTCEGVFTKFPKLRLVLIESGVTWLPSFLWRFDKTWRALRIETPWVKKHPTEIVRENVRLTATPFDGPDDPYQVERLIEHIGCDDLLLFATDYPHWQFDGENALPPGLQPELIRKICVDNPLAAYPRIEESLR